MLSNLVNLLVFYYLRQKEIHEVLQNVSEKILKEVRYSFEGSHLVLYNFSHYFFFRFLNFEQVSSKEFDSRFLCFLFSGK